MAMKIAAHVVAFDESRRLAGEGRLAELGRAPGDAEPCVHAGLVRRLGQRLERVDVRRSAGPPHQLRAEAAGLRKGERHRHALDGHAERGAVGPFDDRHDLREPVERIEDLGGSRGRDDDREVEREICPAARDTGHLPTERLGDLADEVSSGVQQQATPRSVRLRVQALEDPALGRGSDARHALQRALAGDPAEVLGGLGAEGSGDVQHPLRCDPEQAAEPDELRSNRAAELVQLGDRTGLASSRSRAAIPGPIPRSSRTRPSRTSTMIGALVSRIVAAARRYAREAYGVDSARSRSAANASSSAATVALSRSAGTRRPV